MAIKATDRTLIRAYGEELSASFADIRGALEALVSGVAAANYEGANAVQFKQAAVNSCVEFAGQCENAMGLMADDVHNQTSYIATALGGSPIEVTFTRGQIQAPAVSTDDSVELADSSALGDMKSLVITQMDLINGFFDDNMDNFNRLGASNGWVGEEYDTLQGQISTTTTDVKGDIDVAKSSLVETIDNQLAALGMA